MSLSDLATTIVNLRFLIEEQQTRLHEQGLDADVMLALSENYRRLGCGLLLIDLDAEELVNNLYLSGVVYRELLRARKTHQLDPYYLTCSFGWPLLDAIGAGAEALAADIAQQMPRTLMPDQGEDAEDFSYLQLLMTLASQPPAETALAKVQLEAFAGALQGGSGSRLGVMSALVNSESKAFKESFDGLLDEWKTGIEKRRKAGRLDAYEAPTTANVCIEGLALVRLAKKRGVETREEYPYIPEPAIALIQTAFPSDAAALG